MKKNTEVEFLLRRISVMKNFFDKLTYPIFENSIIKFEKKVLANDELICYLSSSNNELNLFEQLCLIVQKHCLDDFNGAEKLIDRIISSVISEFDRDELFILENSNIQDIPTELKTQIVNYLISFKNDNIIEAFHKA